MSKQLSKHLGISVEEWTRAQQGDAEAQYQVGLSYLEYRDYPNALQWFEQAAAQKHSGALCAVGDLYFYGNGIKANRTTAFDYYKQAADLGYDDGLYNLGLCHYSGYGTKQDYPMALECFGVANGQGHVDACYMLGVCFFDEKEFKKAIDLFREAAENDHWEACYRLGEIYETGIDTIPQDRKEAIHYFELAANANHRKAMAKLYSFYQVQNKQNLSVHQSPTTPHPAHELLTYLNPPPGSNRSTIITQSSLGPVYLSEYSYGEYKALRVAVFRCRIPFVLEAKLPDQMEKRASLHCPQVSCPLAYSCQGEFIMVNELADLGNLATILQDDENYPVIPWHRRLSFAYDIARGMEYLHAQDPPMIFRELNTSNVLIRQDWTCFLSGFGLRDLKDRITGWKKRCLKYHWMAPEMFLVDNLPPSPLPDIYSFGLILYSLLTRRTPWRHFTLPQVAFAVSSGTRPSLGRVSCPEGYIPLMNDCLNQITWKRPKARTIVERLQEIRKRFGTESVSPDLNNKWESFTMDRLFPNPMNAKDDCLVGRGDDCWVYRGEYNCEYNCFPVAVKVASGRSIKEWKQDWKVESKRLTSLDHPNLCRHFALQADVWVMEYPSNTLNVMLQDTTKYPELPWLQRVQMAIQIAQGLDYLHCKKNDLHTCGGNTVWLG